MEEFVSQLPKKNWKDRFTKVTTFSKYLALVLFVALPFVGGLIGYYYSPVKSTEIAEVTNIEIESADKHEIFESNGDNIIDIASTSGYGEEAIRDELNSCHNQDWFCYKYLALMIRDVRICQFAPQNDRDICVFTVAPELDSIAACNYIMKLEPDSIHRFGSLNSCYSQIGINRQDTKICDLIGDDAGFGHGLRVITSERDQCYLGIAEAKKDESYCQKISDDSSVEFYNTKDYCHSLFSSQ